MQAEAEEKEMSGIGGGKPGNGGPFDAPPLKRFKDITSANDMFAGYEDAPNKTQDIRPKGTPFFEYESRHAAKYHCHAETFAQFIKYCYYGYLEWRDK